MPFKYTLTVKNTGNVDVTNPVITDVVPDRRPRAADPARARSRTTPSPSPAAPGCRPTRPTSRSTPRPPGSCSPSPTGSTLPIGATYTITFWPSPARAWPAGTAVHQHGRRHRRPAVGRLRQRRHRTAVDPSTGQCRTIATDTVISAGAMQCPSRSRPRAPTSSAWPRPVVRDRPRVNCTPNAAGFYTAALHPDRPARRRHHLAAALRQLREPAAGPGSGHRPATRHPATPSQPRPTWPGSANGSPCSPVPGRRWPTHRPAPSGSTTRPPRPAGATAPRPRTANCSAPPWTGRNGRRRRRSTTSASTRPP